jgi:hypothetical protein
MWMRAPTARPGRFGPRCGVGPRPGRRLAGGAADVGRALRLNAAIAASHVSEAKGNLSQNRGFLFD